MFNSTIPSFSIPSSSSSTTTTAATIGFGIPAATTVITTLVKNLFDLLNLIFSHYYLLFSQVYQHSQHQLLLVLVVFLLLHHQLQQPMYQLRIQVNYLKQQHSVRFNEKNQLKIFLFCLFQGSTSIIQKPKESSDPIDQLSPAQLNDLVDNFV